MYRPTYDVTCGMTRAYGFWAPAIAAYQASGIMRWAGSAELASLLEIEDPFAYRDRLSMPKFVINSAGDQYFLPDSSRFYFDALIGEPPGNWALSRYNWNTPRP